MEEAQDLRASTGEELWGNGAVGGTWEFGWPKRLTSTTRRITWISNPLTHRCGRTWSNKDGWLAKSENELCHCREYVGVWWPCDIACGWLCERECESAIFGLFHVCHSLPMPVRSANVKKNVEPELAVCLGSEAAQEWVIVCQFLHGKLARRWNCMELCFSCGHCIAFQ